MKPFDNYSCYFTEDAAEKEAYFSLRQTINQEFYGIKVDRNDNWDKDSLIFIVNYKDQLVGGSRLTIKHPLPLPMETRDFDLCEVDIHQKDSIIAEYSKLVIHPSVSRIEVTLQQYITVEKVAKQLGINLVYSVAAQLQARSYSFAFNHYQRHCMGQSRFEILHNVKLPRSVKQKYMRDVNCLTRVLIA